MVRLFGAVQTKETRNEKIQLIDQSIIEEERKITECEESIKYDFNGVKSLNHYLKHMNVCR